MAKLTSKELQAIWQKVPVDYYDRGIKENLGQKLWHQQKLEAIKKTTIGLHPKKILDIGSNGGTLTAKIAKIFPRAKTIGLDIYQASVKHAQKKYPRLKFVIGDAQKLPFKKRSFDLIFCLETIEHLVSPRKALREIKRCLKPNGAAIISMDSGNFFFNFLWFFWTRLGRGKVWHGSHLQQLDRRKLRKMILTEGFEIEKEITSHLGMAVAFKIKTQ
jgi:ubiquinone/menaquinone biosynthesis C-methylase UbiE